MRPRRLLLAHLADARQHVLATVEGLTAEQLDEVRAPSGWSFNSMLSHLFWDDGVFWVDAVIFGDADAIETVQDGWTASSPSGLELVEAYRRQADEHAARLADADLDVPPAWWPEDFPGKPFESACDVLFRVLAETRTHAGHLDLARELLDGKQHLVVG